VAPLSPARSTLPTHARTAAAITSSEPVSNLLSRSGGRFASTSLPEPLVAGRQLKTRQHVQTERITRRGAKAGLALPRCSRRMRAIRDASSNDDSASAKHRYDTAETCSRIRPELTLATPSRRRRRQPRRAADRNMGRRIFDIDFAGRVKKAVPKGRIRRRSCATGRMAARAASQRPDQPIVFGRPTPDANHRLRQPDFSQTRRRAVPIRGPPALYRQCKQLCTSSALGHTAPKARRQRGLSDGTFVARIQEHGRTRRFTRGSRSRASDRRPRTQT